MLLAAQATPSRAGGTVVIPGSSSGLRTRWPQVGQPGSIIGLGKAAARRRRAGDGGVRPSAGCCRRLIVAGLAAAALSVRTARGCQACDGRPVHRAPCHPHQPTSSSSVGRQDVRSWPPRTPIRAGETARQRLPVGQPGQTGQEQRTTIRPGLPACRAARLRRRRRRVRRQFRFRMTFVGFPAPDCVHLSTLRADARRNW